MHGTGCADVVANHSLLAVTSQYRVRRSAALASQRRQGVWHDNPVKTLRFRTHPLAAPLLTDRNWSTGEPGTLEDLGSLWADTQGHVELNFDEMQTLMFHSRQSSQFSKVEVDVNVAPFQGSSCRTSHSQQRVWPLSGSSVFLAAESAMEVGRAGAEQAWNPQL